MEAGGPPGGLGMSPSLAAASHIDRAVAAYRGALHLMVPRHRDLPGVALAVSACLLLAASPALRAQQAAAPAAAAASAPARPQQVEVTGTTAPESNDERRRATASRITFGREELDRMGDASLGEVLKRLPGVTVQGPPGRGGPPRMRGLGAGYTQILIDGQRVPPGFSLESLTPEQIERIEILRAPTAETGARAIGGTINIITREGYKRRINDLRLGFSVEDGQFTPGLFWTRNDSVGDLIYTVSAGAFRNRRTTAGSTHTTETDLDDGTLLRDQFETSSGLETRTGINLTSRLQWRLSPTDTLVLMPVLLMLILYAFYAFTNNKGIGPTIYLVVVVMMCGSVLLSSLKRGTKNIPIVKKNLQGDKYYGYTPDWQNFLKCSEWCADSLPASSLVASRKAPMSFVYGKGKKFFPIYSVIKKDSATNQSNPDSALAFFKEKKVTHIMLGTLRLDPNNPGNGFINTVHNIAAPIAEKYPQKLKLVHIEGQFEEAAVYEIVY